jgi:hypothetical protein
MIEHASSRLLLAVCPMALLAACGGGSGGIASAPAPAPAPGAPSGNPSGPPVVILEAPATQEFATYTTGDPLRIRYDAATKSYEVMNPGGLWKALVDYPGQPDGSFQFASGSGENLGSMVVDLRSDAQPAAYRYRYASFASWFLGIDDGNDHQSGQLVFGTPTPAGGMPQTGSASYSGMINGEADVPTDLGGYGTSSTAPLGGSVALQVDFASGSVSGRLSPVLSCDCVRIAFPEASFAGRIAGGANAILARFDGDLVGANSFTGVFAGPRAQEAFGPWTFPFLMNGAAHSASGIWIAKQD